MVTTLVLKAVCKSKSGSSSNSQHISAQPEPQRVWREEEEEEDEEGEEGEEEEVAVVNLLLIYIRKGKRVYDIEGFLFNYPALFVNHLSLLYPLKFYNREMHYVKRQRDGMGEQREDVTTVCLSHLGILGF